MRHISLFSGAGGSEWAALLLGLEIVCYAERDDYCSRVIAQRIADGIFPAAPILSDVTAADWSAWRGHADIITAGFPCQPFSVAGSGKAADDSRNLWPETLRAIREVEPAFAFLENVPGLLAGSHGYFGAILGELAGIGFDAEWSCLSAKEVGAPHKSRNRVWVLAAHPHRLELWLEQGRRSGQGRDGSSIPTDNSSPQPLANADSEGELQQSEPGRQVRGRSCDGASKRRGWWSVEPGVGRVVHGLANRGDRIAALGNGWVPRVAALAFVGLMERTLCNMGF